MRLRIGLVLFAFGAASGCQQEAAPGPDVNEQVNARMVNDAQAAFATAPLGRYQSAGKRDYGNGTEVYMVDTRTGRVCAGFIPTKDGTPVSYCTANPD